MSGSFAFTRVIELTHYSDFKSKKIRINLNTPLKAEQKTEATDVLKTVDEDRKYVIQATIVRYVIPVHDIEAFLDQSVSTVS